MLEEQQTTDFSVTFRTDPISMFRTLVIILLFSSRLALSQTRTLPSDDLAIQQNKPVQIPPCVQPAPLYSAADYEGPLKKMVVYFARKPEIKTVHPHLRPGMTVCALDASEKFHLFRQDSIEPVTMAYVGRLLVDHGVPVIFDATANRRIYRDHARQ